MRIIPLTDRLAVGITSQNTIMFQRIYLRSHAYRKLFKLRREEDLDPKTFKQIPDEEVREVLKPYRMRPNKSKVYPMNGERERSRRQRQIAKRKYGPLRT